MRPARQWQTGTRARMPHAIPTAGGVDYKESTRRKNGCSVDVDDLGLGLVFQHSAFEKGTTPRGSATDIPVTAARHVDQHYYQTATADHLLEDSCSLLQ